MLVQQHTKVEKNKKKSLGVSLLQHSITPAYKNIQK